MIPARRWDMVQDSMHRATGRGVLTCSGPPVCTWSLSAGGTAYPACPPAAPAAAPAAAAAPPAAAAQTAAAAAAPTESVTRGTGR